MTPRSVRNNNPGNLRKGSPWQGLMAPGAMNADQLAERQFCVFENAVYGFRALGITLLNYQRIYGLSSISSMISRYAPENENATVDYALDVAKDCGVDRFADYDLHQPGNLEKAARSIATHEAGGWFFSDADLENGIGQAKARVSAWA